jgi:hypothetical protein
MHLRQQQPGLGHVLQVTVGARRAAVAAAVAAATAAAAAAARLQVTAAVRDRRRTASPTHQCTHAA